MTAWPTLTSLMRTPGVWTAGPGVWASACSEPPPTCVSLHKGSLLVEREPCRLPTTSGSFEATVLWAPLKWFDFLHSNGLEYERKRPSRGGPFFFLIEHLFMQKTENNGMA